MILADYRFGRLGNHLHLAANLVLFAERFSTPVALLFMRDVQDSFPWFRDHDWMVYPAGAAVPRGNRVLLWLLQLGRAVGVVRRVDFLRENRWIFFDEERYVDRQVRSLVSTGFVFFKAWRFRSRVMSAGEQRLVREVFRPAEPLLERARSIVRKLAVDVVVGIHVRWGDVRESNSPDYFPLEAYVRAMEGALEVFAPARVGFVVCSEEAHIPGLEGFHYLHSGGSPMEDLVMLACCDYLVSNGSTFARWASFWGEKPMYTLVQGGDRPGRDDFVPYIWDYSGL